MTHRKIERLVKANYYRQTMHASYDDKRPRATEEMMLFSAVLRCNNPSPAHDSLQNTDVPLTGKQSISHYVI